MIITPKNTFQLNQFISLPETIYLEDPDWVKPLAGSKVRDFYPSINPALRHSEIELHLALEGHMPVARVASFVDRQYNLIHKEKTAFFGFFESIDSPAVAKSLFSAVEHFAKQRGMQKITGPVDFSTNYQAGLLVEGFSRPSVMSPYNKTYYQKLIETCGYQKAMDLYSYVFDQKMEIPKRILRVAQIVEHKRPEISVKSFNQISGINKTAVLKTLYNESFANNWGFIPMGSAEFSSLLRSLAILGHESLNYIAFDQKSPIGLLLTVPDLYSPEFDRSKGTPSFRTTTSRLRVTVLGILPAYRNKGIESLLGITVLTDAFKKGYREIEFSVVLENNNEMNNLVRREFGLPVNKTFRVYEKPIVN